MTQPISELSFNFSDFNKYEWTEVLDKTTPQECRNYSVEFQRKAEEYQISNDILAQEIFTFLSDITSVLIKPLEVKNISVIEKQILSTFSDSHLALLGELLPVINDPEMRARVADILWICKKRDPERARPIQMAKIAVESYLHAAKNFEDPENWMSCDVRLQRAAKLAPLIDGKKSTVMRSMVVDHIDKLIDNYALLKNEFITSSAMKVLQKELRKSLSSIRDIPSYTAKYASIAANKAIFAENIQNYHEAYYAKLAYRQIEAEWYKIAKDKEAERNAKLHIAEIDVVYAHQAFIGNEHNSYAVAAGRIENAISILRRIEDGFGQRQDTSERIQELHKQMLDYQQKSMSRMMSIPVDPILLEDDTEMQQKARDLVTGKSLQDALYSLAFACVLIQSPEDLKVQAEKDSESYKLMDLVPTALVDQEGKTKAISGTNEDSLEDTMFTNLNHYQSWCGFNFIAPACKQICSEHDVNINDLSFIVKDNPFIPEKRETLYARGLLAGLQEDPIIMGHLLIPQLENSLRSLLKQHGFIASSLTSKMIQDEYTLNKVLELPELREVLTDDIIFSLKGLLVERMGFNCRNEICHGLFDYDQFFQAQILYLWWLILYLCLYAQLQAKEE